jgi:hypothetical protein
MNHRRRDKKKKQKQRYKDIFDSSPEIKEYIDKGKITNGTKDNSGF